MRDDNGDDFVKWVSHDYIPMLLLDRKVTENKSVEHVDEIDSIDILYKLSDASVIEKLDQNICLFLNELTGYGHLFSEQAIAQKKKLRQAFVNHQLEFLSKLVQT